jgi:hypothetical protein
LNVRQAIAAERQRNLQAIPLSVLKSAK